MNKHKIKIGFRCELCDQEFDLHRDVITHRNKTHRREDGRFYCDKCGKKYVDYHHYLTHMRSHYSEGMADGKEEDEQGAICRECGKVFKKPDGMFLLYVNMLTLKNFKYDFFFLSNFYYNEYYLT